MMGHVWVVASIISYSSSAALNDAKSALKNELYLAGIFMGSTMVVDSFLPTLCNV